MIVVYKAPADFVAGDVANNTTSSSRFYLVLTLRTVNHSTGASVCELDECFLTQRHQAEFGIVCVVPVAFNLNLLQAVGNKVGRKDCRAFAASGSVLEK